jgi:hypothetical protein
MLDSITGIVIGKITIPVMLDSITGIVIVSTASSLSAVRGRRCAASNDDVDGDADDIVC